MKLYEISQEYRQAFIGLSRLLEEEQIDQDTFNDSLSSLQLDLEQKCLNTARIIKELEAEIKAIKEVEDARKKQRQSLENKKDWLKSYLLDNIQGHQFKSSDIEVKTKKTPPSVKITGDVPDNYLRIIPEKREPDKKLIMAHLKTAELDFAELQQNESIYIK